LRASGRSIALGRIAVGGGWACCARVARGSREVQTILLMMERREDASIASWLGPEARRLQRHELFVAAPADRTYDAIQDVSLRDMPLVRTLFMLRGISYRKEMPLKQFFSTWPFLMLSDDPPREVVFGIAGPFLPRARRKGVELPLTPGDFRAFGEEGCIRAVANFRVDPVKNGSRLSTETWVETFGPAAARRFNVYWFLIAPFSALIRRQFLRAARRLAEEE